MTQFQIHTAETAPQKSAEILENANFIPNIYGVMAESPVLFQGYKALINLFNEGAFTPTEAQVVLMTNNYLANDGYGQAAHTMIANGADVPEDVIQALRNGTPIADPKLETLRQFAIVMRDSRGWPTDEDLEAFFAAGYRQQHVLEVILGTAAKVLSNYTNHIAKTPVDDAFAKHIWSKDRVAQVS